LHCLGVFYEVFPIRDALRHGLLWARVRMLTKLDREDARQWNKNEANALVRIAGVCRLPRAFKAQALRTPQFVSMTSTLFD
jgi:hypothetical protein